MKHNIAKNPSWLNQWAILQAWPRIWTQDYRGQIQLAVRAGLELEAAINHHRAIMVELLTLLREPFDSHSCPQFSSAVP